MPLKLHNTLTNKKNEFNPVDEKHIRMYVCGPTVYDEIHIGNARPLVVFDVLYRVLTKYYSDSKVTYVRNITDVDDKIIEKAEELGIPIQNLTNETIDSFHYITDTLNCLKPNVEPKATDHIGEMINIITALIKKGHAYVTKEGEVLFCVQSAKDYGKLSGRNREEMIAGARVEVSANKRDPADFILWKPSSVSQPGWESEWGRGRPGWHIECSAMSEYYLGSNFDIHGGGIDLVFPHHENEIAQSECFHPEKAFANTWVHNGYLMSEGVKMSKSLGNFYTVKDLLKDFPGEALRLALLATHYRQPIDFTKTGVQEALARLDKYYMALKKLEFVDQYETSEDANNEFDEYLYDDLNTPAALSVLDKQANHIIQSDVSKQSKVGFSFLKNAKHLGLLCKTYNEWRTHGISQSEQKLIEELIKNRNIAREKKDFSEADRIREELSDRGIILEDNNEGTSWRRSY
jgi:cysteinyl-tRNA synthetase